MKTYFHQKECDKWSDHILVLEDDKMIGIYAKGWNEYYTWYQLDEQGRFIISGRDEPGDVCKFPPTAKPISEDKAKEILFFTNLKQ